MAIENATSLPTPIDETPEWRALAAHRQAIDGLHLRDLFAADPDRTARFALEVDGLWADLSRHRLTTETVALLLALARRAGVEPRRDALFAGEHVNTTEDRAAFHPALRSPRNRVMSVDGADAVPAVHGVLDRLAAFAEGVRGGTWRGHRGDRITDVVNLGIGGSDLGPAMAYRALAGADQEGVRCHFVSNVDGADLAGTLAGLDPATTLFVVASKTFTTIETLTNARSARRWVVDALGDEAAVARHFVAVSTNADAVAGFGIELGNMFEFWDWVGGRFSLDSAIGLSLMVGIGATAFRELLDGMAAMDDHFRTAPPGANLPLLMALIGIWYTNFFDAASHAVVPYSQHLELLPAHLQQLEMESNGKSVDLEGRPVRYRTCPVVWGTVGTNGQHAYFQLLHQGPALIPVDFVGVCRPAPADDLDDHQDLLVANLAAQAQALAFGRRAEEVAAEGVAPDLVPHRTFAGNRPSTTLLLPELSPFHLGQLVALYEHKVFCQGVIWHVNSFDQWGVELGKALAGRIAPRLRPGTPPGDGRARGGADGLDGATAELVRRYRAAGPVASRPVRLVIARCSVDYVGRLEAHLPAAVRLLMVKADGSVLVHADGGAYKPLNWMNPPNILLEEGACWVVRNPKGETLTIAIEEVLADYHHELGVDPGLTKDGVEAQLQELLAANPETIAAGLRLVRREYPTELGPVDLLCRDADGSAVAIEVKRRGEIDGVEQLTRYLERLNRDPLLRPVRGLFVAQRIRPQARALAVDRGIGCVEVDYDELRGVEADQMKLF